MHEIPKSTKIQKQMSYCEREINRDLRLKANEREIGARESGRTGERRGGRMGERDDVIIHAGAARA